MRLTQILLEVQVYNMDQIDNYVKSFVERIGSEIDTLDEAKSWFVKSVRAWLLQGNSEFVKANKIYGTMSEVPATGPDWAKKAAANKELFRFREDPSLNIILEHLIDWINSTMSSKMPPNPTPFQRDRANEGMKKIKQLRNIGKNVDEAIRQSNQWTKDQRRRADKRGSEDIQEGRDFKIIKQYPNGYIAVQLLTTAGVRYEGRSTAQGGMGHCVGGYGGQVEGGSCRIYSIWDEGDNPHVTLEVRDRNGVGNVVQAKGKQDRAPVPKYVPFVRDLINEMGFTITGDLRNLGLVKSVDGKVHAIDELEENVKIDGNLDMSQSITRTLPNYLHITGNLIANKQLEELAVGMVVEGEMNLSATKVSVIPPDLKIGGTLVLGPQITEIPRINFIPSKAANVSLELSKTKITTLPPGLVVGVWSNDGKGKGQLHLNGPDDDHGPGEYITELPDDIVIAESLIGSGGLIRLPDNFKLGKSLGLFQQTALTSLPKGLIIRERLDLMYSEITTLPPDIQFIGDTASAIIHFSKLEFLPDNLTIPNSLDIHNCPMFNRLPNNLRVNKTLTLIGTGIKEITPEVAQTLRCGKLVKDFTVSDEILAMITI